jgi:ATP-dependent DNA helicase RecG
MAEVSDHRIPATACADGSRLSEIPVTALRGAGPRVATRLEAIGVRSVQDLLFHLPLRYQDRTHRTPIGALRHGDEALVDGEIHLTQLRYGRRRSLVSMISDGSGRLLLRLFHFSEPQRRALQRGHRVMCYGEARRGPQGMEMVHPEYRLLTLDQAAPLESHLTPVYPTTEGLSQGTLRKLLPQALALLSADGNLDELLPADILTRLALPPLRDAVLHAHQPPHRSDDSNMLPTRQRLAFEELLAHNLSLRQLRQKLDQKLAPTLSPPGFLVEQFLRRLPFELTAAQRRAADEIRADLQKPHPMHRLAQGDVGSGKTVVAALAALQAIESGFQTALMAPTELLAEQHFKTFSAWFEPLGISLAWLSGKQTGAVRRTVYESVAFGAAQMAIGTHALFQEQVSFGQLGLVIVDEQHRFGVHQRLMLRDKGARDDIRAHQLIMTATPIPRTLAMTAYADLDTSVIDALPPGRKPVDTAVVPETRRSEVVARVLDACRKGQQAYWVCTLIEDSETLRAKAAAETERSLRDALPTLRIALVHGRMKPTEKEAVMVEFKQGTIDLLVATTVVEVGVDVPNASLMIIENAERLGLSQLHQLRGRVGRGGQRSACVMLYRTPLSPAARERLNVLRETNDGFKIAQRDLELRGPGELLGTRQTGLLQFRVADLAQHQALLPDVVRAAGDILSRYPGHIAPIVKRWLGDRMDYADA